MKRFEDTTENPELPSEIQTEFGATLPIRFKLEENILACWNITNDIETVFEEVMEGNPTPDQVANILLGIKELYEIKFNKLWNVFEKAIKEGQI